MKQNIVYAEFSAVNQAPALDAEILRMTVLETIDRFGQSQFANSLVETSRELLLAA